MNEIIRFTKQELKCLEHLRLVYDNFNKPFSEFFYGEYVPLGIIIVHFVTVENRFKNELEDYHCRVNKRYIEVASFIADKIQDNTNLIRHPDGSTFEKGLLKDLIKNLKTGKDDNYFGIFVCHIAYDNIINCIKETGYLSEDDNAISIIEEIHSLVKSKLLSSVFTKINNILYSSVKHLVYKKEEFHEFILRVHRYEKNKPRKNDSSNQVNANTVWESMKSIVLEVNQKILSTSQPSEKLIKARELVSGLSIEYNKVDDSFIWTSKNSIKRKNSHSSFHTVYSKAMKKKDLIL